MAYPYTKIYDFGHAIAPDEAGNDFVVSVTKDNGRALREDYEVSQRS
jgi:hypothetical protein